MTEENKNTNLGENTLSDKKEHDNSVTTPSPINKPVVTPKVTKTFDVVKPTAPVIETKPVQATTPKEGGEKTVKDPKGVFDYSGCQTHIVKSGETLLDIAQHYVVALQQLRYFNHLDKQEMKIKPGQQLVIPKEPINVPYGA